MVADIHRNSSARTEKRLPFPPITMFKRFPAGKIFCGSDSFVSDSGIATVIRRISIQNEKSPYGQGLDAEAAFRHVRRSVFCHNEDGNKQPRCIVKNCVALCTVLDVSMDELFGLKASDSKAELHEQNHELEISNIRQEGNIKRLEELNAMLTAQAVRYRTIIFMLLGVCALLLVSVIGYVIFDIQLTTAGLFQSAKTSTLAGFLGLVVLAAIGSIGYAVKTIHKGMKK